MTNLAWLAALTMVSGCGAVAEMLPDGGAGDADAGPGGDPDAAPPAQSIAEALDCGTPASAGGMASGTALQRVDVDLEAFPDARCNDGSPATFYFRPAATPAGAANWVIQLQGGGGCRTPDDCAQRWCSVDTNFGMTQMTSALAPALGTVADGILYRGGAHPNPLGDHNHVFVRYCSSDAWAGRTGPIDVDAIHPVTAAPVRYRIDFRGQDILDAVIATLRRDGGSAPDYTLGGGAVALTDLDAATTVLLAGASAGGNGTINNADRVGDVLRAINPGLDYLALIDSTFGPNRDGLDWSSSTICADTGACTWRDILAANPGLYESHGDASCATWHAANAPDTQYLCDDSDHAIRHHVTTPMMVRMGLRDQRISGTAIATGVSVPGRGPMTLALFSELVHDQLLALGQLLTTAEEAAAMTRTPSTFGPPCADHETLSTDPSVFDVSVVAAGAPRTMFEVFAGWRLGVAPQRAVYAAGDPVDCGVP
jgi:hypothetical protein